MTTEKVLHEIPGSRYSVGEWGSLQRPAVFLDGKIRPLVGCEIVLAGEIIRLSTENAELRAKLKSTESALNGAAEDHARALQRANELAELVAIGDKAEARARAEGRLKGIKDMHTEIHLALADDTEKDRGHVNKWGLSRALRILETAIAAAERELEGGKNDEH